MTPILGFAHGSPQHIAACIGAGNHALAKSDAVIWASLPLVGRMEDIELRNCPCTSTLAIRVQM